MFEALIAKIQSELEKPLPGWEAQFKMAPSVRPRVEDDALWLKNAIPAGVLVHLFPVENKPHLVLMERNKYPGVHSGQISFPGGKHEESDHSLEHTAIREAEEEVGILSGHVQVLREMTKLYIPPSNFLVTPILSFSELKPKFIREEAEVQQILEVELDYLFHHDQKGEKEITVRENVSFETPYYDVFGHTVWGATAMMLSELEALVNP